VKTFFLEKQGWSLTNAQSLVWKGNKMKTRVCITSIILMPLICTLWLSAPTPGLTQPVTTQVVAWGDNGKGQTSVPPELSDVVAVSGGGSHSLALKGDGKVVAWGDTRMVRRRCPGI
jgi:hypothetical protein